MKFIIDMNLSPGWCEVLRRHGWEALHWATVGDPRATDVVIMQFARDHGYIVVTHDLDFGALLAATNAVGPSVIQTRAANILPAHLESTLVDAIRLCQGDLEAGALVTVDESRTRVRILPLHKAR